MRFSALSSDEFKKKSVSNPSTAFGSPLSDATIEMNKSLVGLTKRSIFDTIYSGEGRDYARFYALETIARVPYFSYLAALHFYETIGLWRNSKYLKLHFSEGWNELHHLLIMEELGGADLWFDRFLAQHLACGYYAITLVLYFFNPVLAYNFNHAIEEHAYQTYSQFLLDKEDELKSMPAPQIAIDYYRDGDLYMFDAFQIDTCEPRRPEINNLYDVFVAIRDDELEHVKTMAFLQTDVELTTAHDGLCDVPDDIGILTQ
jgi:ubiquinol oxidase